MLLCVKHVEAPAVHVAKHGPVAKPSAAAVGEGVMMGSSKDNGKRAASGSI